MTYRPLITFLLPRRRMPRFRRPLGPSALWSLHRERRALSRLDRRLLSDVGLSREEAEEEAARPVWDVPDHWRR